MAFWCRVLSHRWEEQNRAQDADGRTVVVEFLCLRCLDKRRVFFPKR